VCKGGIALSDVVTKGHPEIDEKLEQYIEQTKEEKIYIDTDDKDSYVEGYHQLYEAIAS